MFKKRGQADKKVDLLKDIEEIRHKQQSDQEDSQQRKLKTVPQFKKITKFIYKEPKPQAAVVPAAPAPAEVAAEKPQPQGEAQIKYGLIEKQGPAVVAEKDAVMEIYIKQKMKEIAESKAAKPHQGVVDTATEIRDYQKKYLTPTENKIASYDITELQRKLEMMATDMIRSELDRRKQYFRNLLQNEMERIEYSSKGRLKELKQERERTEQFINATNSERGRRYMVNKLKTDVLKESLH